MELFGSKRFSIAGERAFFTDVKLPEIDTSLDAQLLARADAALEYQLTPLTAGMYMLYYENGDRKTFESAFHERRYALLDLVAASVRFGNEKYIRKIIDITWAILEETTWVVPAHNSNHARQGEAIPLPDEFDGEVYTVDLFSASTAAVLALTLKYAGDDMAALTKNAVTDRIKRELYTRIIKPFCLYEMRWERQWINNWIPWIISNVLTVAFVAESDGEVMRTVVRRAMSLLDMFFATYGEDGGCDEGPTYYTQAGQALFDCCELLYDITGGEIDVFSNAKLKKICEYIVHFCISESNGRFVNFADCSPRVRLDTRSLARMGRRLQSGLLSGFAHRLNEAQQNAIVATAFNPHRFIKGLLKEEMYDTAERKDGDVVYGDIEVFISRRGKFFAALKGGNNGESHNHNDVGNVIIYKNEEPVLIDVGTMEYVKKTFSPDRYSIWTMQSSFHNLPEIGGVMEHEWKDYHSDEFKKIDDGKAFVSYTSVYPEEIRPEKCIRTVEVSGDGVTVADEVKSPYDVVFNFMVCREPQISGCDVSLGHAVLSFEGAEKIEAEKVDLTMSPQLMNAWGDDHIFRLRVTPTGEKLTLKIS